MPGVNPAGFFVKGIDTMPSAFRNAMANKKLRPGFNTIAPKGSGYGSYCRIEDGPPKDKRVRIERIDLPFDTPAGTRMKGGAVVCAGKIEGYNEDYLLLTTSADAPPKKGSKEGEFLRRNFKDAAEYIEELNRTRYGGYDGWCKATSKEMQHMSKNREKIGGFDTSGDFPDSTYGTREKYLHKGRTYTGYARTVRVGPGNPIGTVENTIDSLSTGMSFRAVKRVRPLKQG
ncbi:MAG: hypothetical protein V1721_06710 [Pseudomonadota bacterium]